MDSEDIWAGMGRSGKYLPSRSSGAELSGAGTPSSMPSGPRTPRRRAKGKGKDKLGQQPGQQPYADRGQGPGVGDGSGSSTSRLPVTGRLYSASTRTNATASTDGLRSGSETSLARGPARQTRTSSTWDRGQVDAGEEHYESEGSRSTHVGVDSGGWQSGGGGGRSGGVGSPTKRPRLQ